MAEENTYELEIRIVSPAIELKEQLSCWLSANGVDSFVEGQLENLDADHETGSIESIYHKYGGVQAPLSVYSFEKDYLLELKAKVSSEFGADIATSIKVLATKDWAEGWKDSFKPIDTERFRILPPWLDEEKNPSKINIIIDPKMAFGTGQHATTRLCLRAIEDLEKAGALPKDKTLDVGLGSGILSIALKHLGVKEAEGCDIDPDAVLAAEENLARNNCKMKVWRGSLSGQRGYGLVVANILFMVLSELITELNAATDDVLILSGIISEQKEPMLALTNKLGLKLQRVYEEGDWLALVLQKPKP